MLAIVRQSSRARGHLPWLLSYVLLLQALIPLQAHTQLVVGDSGTPMVICTLQGERRLVLGGDPETPTALDEYASPACVFSQLMGATAAAAPVPMPQAVFSAIALRIDTGTTQAPSRRSASQPIRAPPVA